MAHEDVLHRLIDASNISAEAEKLALHDAVDGTDGTVDEDKGAKATTAKTEK